MGICLFWVVLSVCKIAPGYRLILLTFITSGAFLFYFIFFTLLLFSVEFLSPSIHIHPQSVCDTSYGISAQAL